ncbi:anhydro-N-acetylmuramic acid kinase [Mycobacteroides abscessus subsp. abscessus]|uniref:anhydro-N-acetylmuramic acid kinase n=1 Tax=Brevibacterium casei TaxID=33889 RepID=UPI00092A7645|nr:anhydro-N-acetylmuramic acid kinase [Brevibacterium casei]MBE4694159.1 anhydro-N-acetylmuramic acid kinase [Brevibacterium casei]MBY3577282.1 anhydro-N-acetylmuramic acid kinase [Brevibacterium casei]SII02031.1 anhydro-N-acetylmuramic acid kinase [Mycobacteroides abscessus subsp. abscessus]
MIIAGLMTGTSADALDVALAEFVHDPSADELGVRLLAGEEMPFDPALRTDILRLLEPVELPLSLVSDVDGRLGRFSAEALAQVCANVGAVPDLVVSHGQTVRHDIAEARVTSTLQLGQPAWIAETLGVPVLSDVRSRDIAAGGQGAPLVGILDAMLLTDADTPTALLNLGGIANVTVIAPDQDPFAFDTGPANALIDVLARRITDGAQSCDVDGELAARGRVDAALLSDLLGEPYYRLSAPKSTGKEHFHAAYLDRYLVDHPRLSEVDAIATVTALTARTIAEAVRPHGVTAVIASGGGTRNPTLMRALRAELGETVTLETTDAALGLPEGSKEAVLMALIGWLSWHGLPSTEPSLTGASRPTVAGRLSPGWRPLVLPPPLHRRPGRLRILDDPTDPPAPDTALT